METGVDELIESLLIEIAFSGVRGKFNSFIDPGYLENVAHVIRRWQIVPIYNASDGS